MAQPDPARQTDPPRRFHLGCGPLLVPGYVNIDETFSILADPLVPGNLYRAGVNSDVFIFRHDLRKGIPANDNDLQVIYHSHFLEHLTDEEGRSLLADCHRCLAPGGILRLAVPDFRLWCTHYHSGNTAFFDWYRQRYLEDNRARYPTPASVFAAMIYIWDHKMAYDFDSLSLLLSQLSFTQIRQVPWGQSDTIPNISQLEDDPDRAKESLVIECSKPPSPGPAPTAHAQP